MASGTPTPIFDTSQAAFENIAGGLSSLLAELCTLNDLRREQTAAEADPNQPRDVPSVYGCDPLLASKFHSVSRPSITILDYLVRVRKYSPCSNACFIAALVYVDRAHRAVGLVVDSFSVHRLLATAILLATKFFDDRILQNKNHAKIVGLSVSELADLEIEFLKALDFDLNIPLDQYCAFEHTVMMRQAKLKFLATATAATPTNTSSPSPTFMSYGSRSRSVSAERRQPSPVRPPSVSDYERPLSGSFERPVSGSFENSPMSKSSAASVSVSISSTSSSLSMSSVPSDLQLADSKAFIPRYGPQSPSRKAPVSVSASDDFSEEESELPRPRRMPMTSSDSAALGFASARSLLSIDSSYLPPPPRRRGSVLRDPSYTSSLHTIPDGHSESHRHTDTEAQVRYTDEPLSGPRSAALPRPSRMGSSHNLYDAR